MCKHSERNFHQEARNKLKKLSYIQSIVPLNVEKSNEAQHVSPD